MIALSGGTPLALEYFARKRAAREEKTAEELEKSHPGAAPSG
ncbi:MAG: hypothetical protein N2Z22_08535 [Turneriella sp.]|nr:hypothetical protein [Turneriella sp.]